MCEAQEQLAVGLERLAGQGIECGAQPCLGLLEQGEPIRFLEGARLEPGLCPGELHPQLLDAPRVAHLRDERAEEHPAHESRERAHDDERGAHGVRCAM